MRDGVERKTDEDREWISLREVQEILGIGSTKTYELVTTPGGVPSVRIGRAIRVSRTDLASWLEQQRRFAVDE
jgi:excisionase family DNA binding protein